MKKILSLFGILSVLFMFNACSEKEGTLFDYEGKDYWSFTSKEETFEANETGKGKLYLYHLNAATITPVNITVDYGEGSEGLFSLSTTSVNTVDENNKATLEITYNLSSLEFNVPYTLGISVPKQTSYPVKDGLIDSVSITIIRPLTWKKVATGIFSSEFFEEEWEQDLYQANEEKTIYMLQNCYYKNYNMQFTLHPDNSITYSNLPTGYVHSSYGMVSWAMPAATADQPYKEGNTFYFIPRFVVSVGSFGQALETLTLDE